MAIEVTVLSDDHDSRVVTGFVQLWGFYVRGFKSDRHCQLCFRGRRSRHLTKAGTAVGVPYVFDECREFGQLYICGVGAGPKRLRGVRNLHLALVEEEGAAAEVVTWSGFRFVVRNGRELVIPAPDPRLAGLGEGHFRCKNFRFGVAYYGYPGLDGVEGSG